MSQFCEICHFTIKNIRLGCLGKKSLNLANFFLFLLCLNLWFYEEELWFYYKSLKSMMKVTHFVTFYDKNSLGQPSPGTNGKSDSWLKKWRIISTFTLTMMMDGPGWNQVWHPCLSTTNNTTSCIIFRIQIIMLLAFIHNSEVKSRPLLVFNSQSSQGWKGQN